MASTRAFRVVINKGELARHGGRTFEAVNQHKDGTRIPVEVSTTRIGKEDLVLSIVRDIRDRKAAQKELSHAYRIHPDDLERVADEVSHYSITLGRNEFIHKPYRIVTRDNETRWIDDKTTVRRDSDGQIIGYQGIVEDITERKATEDALSAEKERLAVTLHSIRDAVITTDADCRITLMNSLAEQLTGW